METRESFASELERFDTRESGAGTFVAKCDGNVRVATRARRMRESAVLTRNRKSQAYSVRWRGILFFVVASLLLALAHTRENPASAAVPFRALISEPQRERAFIVGGIRGVPKPPDVLFTTARPPAFISTRIRQDTPRFSVINEGEQVHGRNVEFQEAQTGQMDGKTIFPPCPPPPAMLMSSENFLGQFLVTRCKGCWLCDK